MNSLKFALHQSLKNSGSTAVTLCCGMLAPVGIRRWAQQVALVSRSSPLSSYTKRIRNQSTTKNYKPRFAAPGEQTVTLFMKTFSINRSSTSASVLAILLFLALTPRSIAQCGKNLVLTSSKTEYLNAAGVVQRTVDEESVIKISKSEVTIAPSGHDLMTGKITTTTCDWKEPFKTGKTTVEAKFKDGDGTESSATISIEGKAGKIICLMKEKERPDRTIRVTIDKFEEQKSDPKP